MSRRLVVLSALLLLAAGPARAARPAPPVPPTPPATPEAQPAPPAPGDHMIFVAGGGSWLGVTLADIGPDRAKTLGLKDEGGVEITSVSPGSPAAAAGLKKGDVILEYQGTRVEGAMQLSRMVRETPAGRTVNVRAATAGVSRVVKVKVGEHDVARHERMFTKRIEIPPIEIPPIDIPDIDMSDFHFSWGGPGSVGLGVSLEDLGDQLAEYFGVKDGEGILVRSVRKGSPADAAGLKAGDVIVRVADEKVGDSSDLRSALRERRGETFPVGIVRDRREQSVTVTLPRPEEPPDMDDNDEDDETGALLEHRLEIKEKAREAADQARAAADRARAEIDRAMAQLRANREQMRSRLQRFPNDV